MKLGARTPQLQIRRRMVAYALPPDLSEPADDDVQRYPDGNEFADFLLGRFLPRSAAGSGYAPTTICRRLPACSGRTNSRLRRAYLDLRLRWEPSLPWVDRYDRLSSLGGIRTARAIHALPRCASGHSVCGRSGRARAGSVPIAGRTWRRAWLRLGHFRQREDEPARELRLFFDSIKADSVSEEERSLGRHLSAFNGRSSRPVRIGGRAAPRRRRQFRLYQDRRISRSPMSALSAASCRAVHGQHASSARTFRHGISRCSGS